MRRRRCRARRVRTADGAARRRDCRQAACRRVVVRPARPSRQPFEVGTRTICVPLPARVSDRRTARPGMRRRGECGRRGTARRPHAAADDRIDADRPRRVAPHVLIVLRRGDRILQIGAEGWAELTDPTDRRSAGGEGCRGARRSDEARQLPIPSIIRSRRTCSKRGMTSARSRNCSVTGMWPRR